MNPPQSPEGTISFAELENGLQSAEDALRVGHFSVALAGLSGLLERILQRHDKPTHELRAADLLVCERLADLAILFGYETAAENILEAMTAIFDENGNDIAADHAQIRLAELQVASGSASKAWETLADLAPRIGSLEAIEISNAGLRHWESTLPWTTHPTERAALLVRLYVVFAQLLLWMGRYADALRIVGQGLQIAEAKESPDLARRGQLTLRTLSARALLECGRLGEAERALQGLLSMPTLSGNVAAFIQTQLLAGKLDLLRGRFEPAILHLRRVVSACQTGRFQRAHPVALLNLAHALILLNQIEEALRLTTDARRMAMSLGDNALVARADAIRSAAIARRTSAAEAMMLGLSITEAFRGPEQKARPTNGMAASFEAASRGDSFLAFFEDRALQLQWLLNTEARHAPTFLQDLRSDVAHCDSLLIPPRLDILAGLVAVEKSDFESASMLFASADAEFRRLGLKPEAWLATSLRAKYLAMEGQSDNAGAMAAEADKMLAELCDSLPAAYRAVYLLNKSTAEEIAVLTQVNLLVRDSTDALQGRAVSRWRARLRVARRLNAILSQLDRSRARLADSRATQPNTSDPAPVSRHRASLARRLLYVERERAILTFTVLPDRILIIWNAFLRLGFAIAPVSRIQLRQQARLLHEFVQSETGVPSARHLQLELHMVDKFSRLLQLQEVLDSLPPTVTRLTIIADDVLHGIPFSALRHDGGYLVEKYAITMGLASTPSRRRKAQVRGPALVAGVSQSGLARKLHNVPAECDAIVKWLQSRGICSDRLLEKEATPSAVSQALTECALAHIACHGVFEPDTPDRSGLRLHGENGTEATLTLRALAALRLNNCEHATLSSCWSADNFIVPGRWIISLPETLLRSGMGSVLGCLWPVSDEIAFPFMQQFYAALTHLPRDLALRKAQLLCLEGKLEVDTTPAQRLGPLFWAGYVLSGEYSRIAF